MFYALVVDLSGAPQELIDPDEGTVTGWEYGSPDSVDVAPQAATPSGYVSSNPVLWLTRTNSKYAPNYLSLVSGMIGEADSMTNSDEKPTGHFNVVADYPGLNIVTLDDPTKIQGMLERSSSISPEEPYSLYIPEDDCPSGKLKRPE